jgi:ABC-type multidrug transport system fused ATPase/permease subunit
VAKKILRTITNMDAKKRYIFPTFIVFFLFAFQMSFVIVPYFIFLYSILHFIHHLYIKRNRRSDKEEEVTSDIGEEI